MAEGTARAAGGVAVRGEVHRQEAAAGLEDTPYLGEPRSPEVLGQVVQHDSGDKVVPARPVEDAACRVRGVGGLVVHFRASFGKLRQQPHTFVLGPGEMPQRTPFQCCISVSYPFEYPFEPTAHTSWLEMAA